MFADASTSVSLRLSVNSSNHSGRSRKRLPAAPWLSFFWFGVVGGSRQCADTPSSLRKLAGLEEVLDES